jgi:hypothetical protein
MKAILLAALLSGISSASQDPPAQVRVCVQYIEVSHPALTELLGGGETGGHAIHAQARALAEKGDAKILETAMVVCRSGWKASTQSVLEETYPSEYYPDGLDSMGLAEIPYTDSSSRSFPSFEVKETGIRLEAEVTIGERSNLIDVRFIPEFVRRLRLDTWFEHKDQWGDSTMRWPVYEKWSTSAILSLQSGKFELASVINPKDQDPPPAVSRRILLFVRADILEPPSPQ